MNVLGKYVSCFRMQHEALERLKAIDPKPRASAVKLYAWLAFKGIHVHEDVAGIMSRIGLFEGAVVNARKRLVKIGLIEPDFRPGRGASYGHSILNVKTGQTLNWAEAPAYFQVPHSLMDKDHYPKIGGTALLLYLVILAAVNKSGRQVQALTAEMLAQRAGVTPPTLRSVLEELTDSSVPLLRIAARHVELLHPETGQTLHEVDTDGENLTFVEAHGGKRVGMNELLSAENFKRYFCRSLPSLDPNRTQQDVRCPFHADGTPSMSVNTEDGQWFCHACDFGGGMVHFEMRLLGIEDKRCAWQSIGKKLGVVLRGKKLGQPTSEHVWRDAEGDVLFVARRYPPCQHP